MMVSLLASEALGAAASEAPAAAQTAVQTAAESWSQGVLYGVVDIGIYVLGLGFLLCLLRMVKGPTLADRGIASDLLSMQVVGLAILLTIRLQTLIYFDAVLIVAILGFASTVAFAQFIGRRRAV